MLRNFSKTGPPRWIDALSHIVFSQGHNDAMPSLETEAFPSWNDSVKRFPRTQQRSVPSEGIELAILRLQFGAITTELRSHY